MNRSTPNPQTFLPLTAPTFHVLLALADSERHGYGVLQEVQRRTAGRVNMGPGTLYGCLSRMLDTGLVEESVERPDPTLNDQRRCYYRLTNLGRRVAMAEAERLASLVQQAHAKHLLPELEAAIQAAGGAP